jgi:PKD repeat protein
VTDSLTGEPLNARVSIAGHDIDSSHVFTDPSVGDYHRYLKAGSYNVTFSCPGYISKTMQVQITDHAKTIRDVQLYDGSLWTNFSCDQPLISPGAPVHFMDQSAGNPETWNWAFEGGSPATATEQNPTVNYDQPGKYKVKLVVTRPGDIDSLIREEYIEVKQAYLMNNGSYQVCDALFLDSGGEMAAYTSNESSIMTFTPSGSNNHLNAIFLSFDIENATGCENDWLKVYDGSDTFSPLLGSFCNSNPPYSVFASNQQGALTFEFHSNTSIENNGWKILLECDSNVGIEAYTSGVFTIFPNPSIDGQFRVIADRLIDELTVYDIFGHEVTKLIPHSKEVPVVDIESEGIYLVKLRSGNTVSSRKIVIGVGR